MISAVDSIPPVERAIDLTSFIRRAVLTLAILVGVSVHAQSANSDHRTDYASIMSRGFGVADEPSMLDRCDSDYEGIRVFEHAAGRPLALFRVEKAEDGAQVTRRMFEGSRASETVRTDLSETEWTELTGLLSQSGFWTYEMDGGLCMPDSPTLWIEACLTRQYRSISLYPERTDLAVGILDFLSDRVQ